MSNRLQILKDKLDLHLDAAMATIMEMRQVAANIQEDTHATAIQSGALTGDQIAKLLAKREQTIQRKHKSK